MKTIVFLSAGLYNYFFPENAQSFGGVARIHRIVGWLSKNSRYNVKCIVGDYGQPRIQNRDGVTLIRCRINNPWNFFGIYALLRNIKPDLIAEFYPSARLFLLGALNRLHGQRFVYFTGSDIDVDGGYRQLTNALFYRLYVWGLGQADGIICQTENQKALLQKNYGLHGHVILSPYMRISDPVARKREYFLWVGRSNAYKRPDLFMDLAALMPDDNFVMICNPGQHGRDMYGEVSERAGRMPNMVFIQSVPPEKMPAYYAGARWMINTSDFEGFPNTFIEAALQGTPIVSLNVDPNEMLSRCGAGVFCRGSFRRMVAACQKMAAAQEKQAEMGIMAREYAKAHHDIDRAMEKMVKQLDQVMASGGRPMRRAGRTVHARQEKQRCFFR